MIQEPVGELSRDQSRLLQAVYDRLRAAGVWPTFGEVDRALDRGRQPLDARRVARSIPEVLLPPLGSFINAEQPIRLAIQGVAACEGSDDDVELFVQAVRWMGIREWKFQPPPGSDTGATADSRQLMRAYKIPRHRTDAVARLGQLLLVETWGWRNGGPGTDGGWNFNLTRQVRRFRRIRCLDDYQTVRAKWQEDEERDRLVSSMPLLAVNLPAAERQSADGYVSSQVIAAIEGKRRSATWQCDRLLQLIGELNVVHANGCAFAANALLRAIVDHVPPLFGEKDFAQVANNHPWSRTDKSYMKGLLETRKQGGEALHRQITKRAGTQLSMDDLPGRRPINRLLEECVARL